MGRHTGRSGEVRQLCSFRFDRNHHYYYNYYDHDNNNYYYNHHDHQHHGFL